MWSDQSHGHRILIPERIERDVRRAHRLRAFAYRRTFGRIWRAVARLFGRRPDAAGAHALRLQRGRVLNLSDSSARAIKSVEGTLWITPGDASDIVLEAGERFEIVEPDRLLVSPLGDAATVEVVHEQPHGLAG